MQPNDVTKIIDVNEIWPETETAILLMLAASNSTQPFVIWAESKSDKSKFISEKRFATEGEARKAFELLTNVLVEIRDPMIDLLREAPLTRRQ